jgi:alpha-D-xyloside xylohydrolase
MYTPRLNGRYNAASLHRLFTLAFALIAAASPVARAAGFLEQNATEIRLHNANATLTIDRNAWRMRLLDPTGTEQFGEAAAPSFQIGSAWQPLTRVTAVESAGAAARVTAQLADGGSATVVIEPYGPSGFHVVITPAAKAVTAVRGATTLSMVEEVYGFGEMWNGHVAQRGQSFDLWDNGGTPDECAYMPYYVSTRNYAFFLNYGGRVHFDVGQRRADVLTYEAPTAVLDIALVRGDSIPAAVHAFLAQVGMPQRPPRWAFKPWFWLMGDVNHPGAKIDTLRGEHFVEMVRKLHELSIPIGVTWFEPPWQDGRTTFVPNPAFSPDLSGLVKQLSDLGVHTLAWTVPYTTNTASNWKDAVEHHYIVSRPGAAADSSRMKISGSGELVGTHYNSIDFYNPEAVRWWEKQIERGLQTGISGYKLDAGQDLEPDAQLYGGRVGRDVHNSYALEYDRVFFETLKKHFGDDFLMIPRAAWVGSSAYTNFKWPGDLSGSFANNGLPSSVCSSLSLAFCGIPFVATDIGGFEDQPAPERPWLRWAQFGAMLPGMQTLHMPWWYSPESLKHFRFLAWLHTDLTPLWMTLAHQAAETGAPVCRPLVWTFQDDIDCWRVDDEFTVGDSLLVAPMLNNNPDRPVYLPAGRWYDFWDDAHPVAGPAKVSWFKGWTALDKFPLYIREGAIIPLEVSNEYSGFGWAESAGYVTLAIWPKESGESGFTLHDTEGPVQIRVRRAARDLQIDWTATSRNHLLRVHLSAAPATVTDGNSTMTAFPTLDAFRHGGDGWWFDAAHRKLWIRKANHGASGSVRIELTN